MAFPTSSGDPKLQGGSGTNTVMYYINYVAFKLTETQGRFGYANAMGVGYFTKLFAMELRQQNCFFKNDQCFNGEL